FNLPLPNYSLLFNPEWIKRIGHVRDGYTLHDIETLIVDKFHTDKYEFNSRVHEELDAFYNKGIQEITDRRLDALFVAEADTSREPYGLTIACTRVDELFHPLPATKSILHVGWGHPPNLGCGPIYYLQNLCLAQQAKGLSVACFVASNEQGNGPAPTLAKKKYENVSYHIVENRSAHYYDWSNPRREVQNRDIEKLFSRTLEEVKPALVHFHNLIGLSMSLPAIAKEFGCATLLSVHNYWMLCTRDDLFAANETICPGPGDGARCGACVKNDTLSVDYMMRTAVARRILSHSIDAVSAVSEKVKAILQGFGVAESKIIVQHIGSKVAEENWLRVQNRTRRKKQEQPVRFGFLGSVICRKGAHIILDAVNKLGKLTHNFEVRIHGHCPPGAYENRLNSMIERSEILKQHVRLMGGYSQDQILTIADSVDIIIIPPIWEDNAPQTVMEALASGVPVIGSNVGGIPDFVRHGKNGLLFKAGDADDLCARMLEIIEDETLLDRLYQGSEAPLPMYEHNEQLLSLYEQLPHVQNTSFDAKASLEEEICSWSSSAHKEELVALRCFFADGSSSQEKTPPSASDSLQPGILELTYDLSKHSGLHALRIDMHVSFAVVKIHGIVLERKKSIPLDLMKCMVVNGTSFGEHVYFFEGTSPSHIGFSPLPADQLKDARALKLKLYYAAFGPQAITDCLREMRRLQASHDEIKETIQLSQIVSSFKDLKKATAVHASPEEVHSDALALANAGKTDEAISALESLLEHYSKYAVAHNDLGVLYLNKGEPEKAQYHYQHAAALDPQNLTFSKNLADLIFVVFGRTEDAITLYSTILDRFPDDIDVLKALSLAYLKQGHREKSGTFSEKVLSIDTGDPDALQIMSELEQKIYESSQRKFQEGDYQGAITDLKSLLASNPDYAVVHNDLGVLYERVGQQEQALTHYEKAVQLNSKNPTFRKNLAYLYFTGQKRIDDAIHIYSDLLNEYPEDAENLVTLAYAQAFLGRFDIAMGLLQNYQEKHPKQETQAITDCMRELSRMQESFGAGRDDASDPNGHIELSEVPGEQQQDAITKFQMLFEKPFVPGQGQKSVPLPSLRSLSILPLQQAQPGKIAVHLHLYYIDMADELLPHFAKMPFMYDLFITVVDGGQVPFVEQKARQLCGPRLMSLHVIDLPNRGRDIGAFLIAMGSWYQQYDYLCHVHSKKSLYSGTERKNWCEYLFESLFKDEEHVRRIFGLFVAAPQVGLIYPTTAEEMPYWCHSWLSNNQSAYELFSRLKVGVDIHAYVDFPVGSMMWARSEALKPLFDLKLTFEDFPPEPISNDGTLCHAIERSFCISGYMKQLTFAELDITEGNFTIGEGKKNLWQYWGRSLDHLSGSLQPFQTVSLDIFDTIVSRPLLTPDHAFLLAQHRIEQELKIKIDFLALRKKAEAIVRQKLKPGTDASLQAIYECFREIAGLPSATVDSIHRIEVENEIHISLPRKGMTDLVRRLKRDGKQIVFLSDMYAGSNTIQRILAKHGIDASGMKIMVSSETGRRKDTGEVWKSFLQQIAQVHVGDNEHSDIQMAVDHGVPHYHVMSPRRLFELAQPASQLMHQKTLADSMYAGPVMARLFSSPFALHESRGQIHISDPKDLGYCIFGPVLLYFTTWLFKRSQELGIHHLLFLAREGYLLQQLFGMFTDRFGDKDTRSSYLLCSRRANSVPMIERDADIRGILEAVYTGCLANLLESRFGIDLSAADHSVSLSHKRLYDDDIMLPQEIDAVYNDVLKFKSIILRQAKKEKKAYAAYLKRIGISKKEKTAVVDIGFAGTIHKYLQKLTATDLQGFYFVTNQKARANPLADKMHACFGSFVDEPGNCIYDYSLTLESVLTAADGQLTRFDDDGQPLYGKNAYTDATWPIIRTIHLGIIEYFKDAIHWFGDALLVHDAHRETATHFFRLMSEHPEIISVSLRDALKVDDFYVSNGVVRAFHYAAQTRQANASIPADITFVANYLSDQAQDDHAFFRSSEECNEYFSRIRYDYEERLLVEKILLNHAAPSGRLTYDGYCDCCGKITHMQREKNVGEAMPSHRDISFDAGRYGSVPLLGEDIVCCECTLNSRQRGIFYAASVLGLHLPSLEVYAYEQGDQLSDELRKKICHVDAHDSLENRFRQENADKGMSYEKTLHLDISDGSIDLLVSNEVFEFVSDVERAFTEAQRVLKPGGTLLYSIPFDLSVARTVRRARLHNGQIEYMHEPIYRGSSLTNKENLLFYDFGWDIIDICKRSGFNDSFMLYYYSPNRALLDGGLQFIFVGIKGNATGKDRMSEKGGFSEHIRVDVDKLFQTEPIEEGHVPVMKMDPIRKVVNPDPLPTVSIIIPVFNAHELTRACLASIRAHTAADVFEIILVDNASTDDTSSLLTSLPSNAKFIRNETNFGFARACNQGAKIARAPTLLFLNNDTVVTAGWLEPLLKTIQQPDCGIVGCKLLYPDGRIQHAGISLIDGMLDHPYRHEKADLPETGVFKEMDMVTGACFLIPRELFISLHGFDETYQNGVEDVDLCLRVRQAGYRVCYQPETVLYHHEGQSAGRFDNVTNNLAIFLKRWNGSFGADGRFIVPNEPRLVPSEKSVIRVNRQHIVWEGSQLVRHSLALINRELCLGLIDAGYDVSIIPYEKDDIDPKADPRFEKIMQRTSRAVPGDVDVHVRHQWPPNLDPPKEGHWVIMQPWEFGSLPKMWIGTMRTMVDEVWAISSFVRECYIESGLPADRVFVIPCGVNTALFNPSAEPTKLKTKKLFKFLFVGGTIYRKGIDILLDAYSKAFTSSDEVCLVIKDMGGNSFYKGQTAREVIEDLQSRPGAPEIEYIEQSLSEMEMAGLYAACDCLVHPYRGEGFGLPIAEAMASGLPVIITGYGAALDFCSTANAYLLPSQKVRFDEKKVGELETVNFPWLAEPDSNSLQKILKHVMEFPEEAKAKGSAARSQIELNFSWEKATAKAIQRLHALYLTPIRRFDDTAPQPKEQIRDLVSIIIPVTEDLDATDLCLRNIAAHTPDQLLLVQGSSEKIVAWAQKNVHEKRNYRSITTTNDPRSANEYNRGIHQARGEFILLLDPKFSVTENWLARMLRCLSSAPNIGIVGPRSNNVNGPQNLETAVHSDSTNGAFAAAYAAANRNRKISLQRLDGFCMLFRRSLVEDIGLFDESLGTGAYVNDDFCFRAELAGYENVIAGDVFIQNNGDGDSVGNRLMSSRGERRLYTQKWNSHEMREKYGKKILTLNIREHYRTSSLMGDIDKAVDTLIEAIRDFPEEGNFLLDLAQIHCSAQQFERALEILDVSHENLDQLRLRLIYT
ncbi:MAG: glycosyltransferase, partial [Ignavibacteriales bacterium]|nr:glycosyltransferase [Ignavibacteriales bacterium]